MRAYSSDHPYPFHMIRWPLMLTLDRQFVNGNVTYISRL
jgi:hypothetical protein